MKLKKEDLLYGGAGLVGGYLLGTSLNGISHHAGCPKDCAHLSPADVLTAACLQKCNQNGGLNAFIPPSAGILKTAPGNKISAADAAANKSQPAFDVNPADNLPGGINQFLLSLGGPCIPGLPLPCPIVILGGIAVVLFLLKGRF